MEFDLSREWLATNGIGGFASSTIVGCNTRRYHALLCAATQPPLGRQVLVNKADETLTIGARSFDLGCNQYPGAIHPAGFQYLSEFHRDPLPRWIYRVPAAAQNPTAPSSAAPSSAARSSVAQNTVLERTLWMPHGENRTVVLYRLLEGHAATLSTHPFVSGRDYHGTHRYNPEFDTHCRRCDQARATTRSNDENRGADGFGTVAKRALRATTHISLKPYASCPPIVFSHDGQWHEGGAWYHSFELAVERERGLDFTEDAYCPGAWVWHLTPEQPTAVFVVATQPSDLHQAAQSQQLEIERLNRLQHFVAPHMSTHAAAHGDENRFKTPTDIGAISCDAPTAIATASVEPGAASGELFARRLILAADQFLVRRAASDAILDPANGATSQAKIIEASAGDAVAGEGLHTVLAGYPWFSDWGRDTMIALPGLCLATKRLDIARSILMTFAAAVSQGMIPNRFPDAGDVPDYNTVDAMLWFFHAAARTVEASGDHSILRDGLYDVLRDCIAWHIKGTRYNIKADPNDGMLRSGAAGTQLTWMDAKVNDHVFTPRAGKPVEIQALWFNALKTMSSFAQIMNDRATQTLCDDWSQRIQKSFAPLFWNLSEGALFDFVDGDGARIYRDGAIRPNQIFAVSLPHRLLSLAMEKSVVATVERELLTPFGLRSLSPRDSRYCGTYIGDQWHRDGAYHQGTVWAWLIGPFLSAYLKVNGYSPEAKAQARQWLAPLQDHLDRACVGTISEIFDGDWPHAPRGCFAQAWSVGEVLRVLNEL